MKPIAQMSAAQAAAVRYVLMDIDDTLTTDGKLGGAAYTALWRLYDAGLKVIPVTGRPAGWCDLIARQWPVDGVVGENGALAFWETSTRFDPNNTAQRAHYDTNKILKQEFHPNALRNDHPALARIKQRALAESPTTRIAKDQFSRLFDLAFDFAEEAPVLPLETAQLLKAIAEEEGAQAKISSIHVNVWMGSYDKRSMAERFLQNCFGWQPQDTCAVLFAGDSPNDEPLFERFALSCAVANIDRYRGIVRHLPAFVSQKECGEGFVEIAETLLEKRRSA